ncbi:MAG: glycosyltransferase [Candidatus Margulisiibacteriota bacterium]
MVKLSVCMIVKDEARMLEQTLPALSKQADEIILLDTGSSDDTVEVAKRLGAKVHHFAWVNDFSAARNESLKHATGEWIIWADADEFWKEEDLESLKETLKTAKDNAYDLTIYESKIGQCEKMTGFNRAKVFRNGLGYHFVKPINEQLVEANGQVVKGEVLPVPVYHWGRNLEGEKMNEKRERYVKLYSQSLEKNESDACVHFMLATNLSELKRLPEALEHFNRTAELAAEKDIGRRALEKKADILLRLKKLPDAAKTAQLLLEKDPNNVPARNVFASIYLAIGKIDEAIQVLEEALSIKIEDRIENQYLTKALPNFLLSKAYGIKGDKGKAEKCLEEYKRIMG